jgi:hypothetical protein
MAMRYIPRATLLVMVLGTACLAVTACGDDAKSIEESVYYGSAGAVQCGGSPFTASNVSALAERLSNAGVFVGAISCGNDGLAHSAVCGAPTGDIWIVLAAKARADTLRLLGFAPRSELQSLSEVPCG